MAYPTTPHLRGSRGVGDDTFLTREETERVLAHVTVVHEKLDGVNVGLRHTAEGIEVAVKDRPPSPAERARLDPLVSSLEQRVSGCRDLQLFGELLESDGAPVWYLIDVFDEGRGHFLGHRRVQALGRQLDVATAPVLHRGPLRSLDDVEGLLLHPAQAGGRMEGVVVRIEDGDRLRERYKYVRADFVQVARRLG